MDGRRPVDRELAPRILVVVLMSAGKLSVAPVRVPCGRGRNRPVLPQISWANDESCCKFAVQLAMRFTLRAGCLSDRSSPTASGSRLAAGLRQLRERKGLTRGC
jgi:hypothetical protein